MNIKHKIKIRIIAVFMLQLFLFFSYNGSFSVKAEGTKSNFKKLINYSSSTINAASNTGSVFGHKTSYKPSKIIVKGNSSKKLKADVLESRFDLRDVQGVTSVKNQGEIGACWTFSSIASLESYEKYKNNVTKDYSELNMMTNTGFDYDYNNGGNREMSAAYLSRWNGPVLEDYDPYPAAPATVDKVVVRNNLPVDMHLKDAIYLPARLNALDNTRIKEAVKNYGAVSTAIYMNEYYYNSAAYAYNYPAIGGAALCNHAINIVGWDDNYSAGNFLNVPEGNGAFICRNSWGPSWGDSGYFYVSYYDTSIANEGTVYIDESNSDYTANYGYDKYGCTNFIGDSTSLTAYFANVFTASRNEKIDAVGFYTMEEGATYTVSIIKDFNGSFSEKTQIKSGILENAGYHTVSIGSIADLLQGSKFAVVVKVTNPTTGYQIPIEQKIDGYTSNASSEYGQSYVSIDGQQFTDLKNEEGFGDTNVCLKVFTNAYTAPEPIYASADVKGGTYYKDVNVTLTSSRAANIYYTLDGITPTSGSNLYSSPIAITSNKTLKFFAQDSAGVKSDVVTENYVIDKTLPNAPGNFYGVFTNNVIKLTWNTVTKASLYNIYRASSLTGTYLKIGSSQSNAYQDTSILLGKTYYYKAASVNINGEGAKTSAVPVYSNIISVKYQGHVQNIGWQSFVSDGAIAGTTGKGLRIEAFKILLKNQPANMNIVYKAHVQSIGWQAWVKNGAVAGTTGRSLRVESLEIKLENAPAGYHVVYQGYVQNKGWLNWVADGASCGTTGQSLRMEAVRIKIVKVNPNAAPTAPVNIKVFSKAPKNVKLSWDMSAGASSYNILRAGSNGVYSKIGSTAANQYTDTTASWGTAYGYKIQAVNGHGSTNSAVVSITTEDVGVKYQGHVQNIGWQSWVADSAISGTIGKGLRIESFKVVLKNPYPNMNIVYRAHVQNIGWQSWVKNGAIAGTTGKALRIESLQIKLENAPAGYHVMYQGYVQNKGWLNWVADGASCGTVGESLRMEAVRIKIVKIKPNTSPAAPANLKAAAKSPTKIYLSWDQVPNASSYKIYRASESSGYYYEYLAATTASNYLNTGLNVSSDYYYKVIACNSYGTSGNSNEAYAKTKSLAQKYESESNNTFSYADYYPLTWDIDTSAIMAGTLNGFDTDYYYFNMSKAGIFNFSFIGVANVQIFNSNKVLVSSYSSDIYDTYVDFSKYLPVGKYYIKIASTGWDVPNYIFIALASNSAYTSSKALNSCRQQIKSSLGK